ncbi:MAG TPA: hypothetical protein DGG94_00370 [Micromonosporaceae bacterium]|nr:hypothetical protein [Micromonosporaceae bacterium]HCU48286.1 hypothetical protein [Micromonosporaceae bacterium]
MLNNRPLYLLMLIPELVVAVGVIVAFIFALAKRRRIGAAASALAAVGLAILELNLILGLLFNLGGIRFFVEQFGPDAMEALSAYHIASRMLYATGMGLIIGAIFVRRPAPQPSSAF